MKESVSLQSNGTSCGFDNNLPKGWIVASARDVIELKYGKALKAENRVAGKYVVYGSNGPVGVHNSALSRGPTVVVGRKGSVGMVHYSPEPCWPIDTTYFIDDFDRIIPEYLAYYLSSLALQSLDTSTAVPGLNRNDVYDQLLVFPPLVEQRRIVAKIEALLTRQKKAAEHLARAKELLKSFRQSIIATACAEGDTVCLGDILEDIKYGTSVKCDYKTNSTPVLRIPNVVSGKIDISDLKYAILPPREYERLRLKRGDILVVRSNGSASLLRKTAIVTEAEEGFAYAGYLMRLRLDQKQALPDFVQLALSSYAVRVQIEVPSRSTSGVHNINSEEVKKLQLILPTLDKQKSILDLAHSQFTLADTIEQHIESAGIWVGRLPSAILTRAFRGELVPTEAELVQASGRVTSKPSRATTGEMTPDEVDALFYPRTDADRAVRSVACEVLEQVPSLSSMDHLDAVLLATHPRICRIFLNTAERRTFDKACKVAPQALFLTEGVAVNWQECRDYLEKSGYINVDHFASRQPLTRTATSTLTLTPAVAAVSEVARFALIALKKVQQARRPSARVSQEKRAAVFSLRQLAEVA